MISLSPLPSAHPSRFQPTLVRTFTACYCSFILTMGRSPGFGSTACNSIALFRLAFAAAPSQNELTLLQTVTPRLIMQKARRQAPKDPPTACKHAVSGTISLSFSEYFSTFPHRYWFAIGHKRVFSLGGWSPQIPTGFPVPRGTREH